MTKATFLALITFTSYSYGAVITTSIDSIGPVSNGSSWAILLTVFLDDQVDCDGHTTDKIFIRLGTEVQTNASPGSVAFLNYTSIINAAEKGYFIDIDEQYLTWSSSYGGRCETVDDMLRYGSLKFST